MRDVIVIGSGGGGAVVAKELASRGLDVLVLEAGPHPRPEDDWSHFEHDANDLMRGFLRFGPGDRDKPPWRRDIPYNGAVFQSSGVGGTTQHYYGNSPRAMPGAFIGHRPRRGEAPYDSRHRFPFTYRSLIPFYEWVEETLPVRTAAVGRKEEVFLRAAERLELPLQRTKDITVPSYRPQENAILAPRGTAGLTADPARLRFPEARGCTFCGHCFQGCMHPHGAPRNLFARRSTDTSYVPMALTADAWADGGRAITLVADAFATRISVEEAPGRPAARSVSWRIGRTGDTQTDEARVVVVAAGAIESPRLWLNSGLPDPNGWVGRGLTDHHMDRVIGLLPEDIGSSRGAGSSARIDVPGRGAVEQGVTSPMVMAGVNASSDSGIAGHYDNGAPVGPQGADVVGRRIGNDLKKLMADVDRLFSVFVLTDDDVEPQNRVRLSDQPDEHGPIARVEISPRRRSARTHENRELLVRLAVELARKAGATHVWRPNNPPFLAHIHSTMRMGARERDSVLDEHAESRAVRRLYVADNSALANALGGPNPTLTTQAIATRAAEHIFVTHFQGDPWIGREAPVRSIDAVVTRAVVRRGV